MINTAFDAYFRPNYPQFMTALEIVRSGGDFSRYAKLKDLPRSSAKRLSRARAFADKAAHILKHEYGASRVVLYGSLAREHYFNDASDIDLVTWGISGKRFLQAWERMECFGADWKISLRDVGSLSSPMRETVRRDGVDL